MRSRLLTVAASLALLAGCSDPPQASPLPTGPSTTADASSTSSPTQTQPDESTTAAPVPPTLPPEATTNDAAGAEAFVRYWFDALSHSLNTGDSSALEAASTDDCEVCESYIDEVEGRERDDQHLAGVNFEIVEAIAPAPDATGSILVSTVFSRSATDVIDASGEVVETIGPEEGSVGSVLIRRGESWLMYGIGA